MAVSVSAPEPVIVEVLPRAVRLKVPEAPRFIAPVIDIGPPVLIVTEPALALSGDKVIALLALSATVVAARVVALVRALPSVKLMVPAVSVYPVLLAEIVEVELLAVKFRVPLEVKLTEPVIDILLPVLIVNESGAAPNVREAPLAAMETEVAEARVTAAVVLPSNKLMVLPVSVCVPVMPEVDPLAFK